MLPLLSLNMRFKSRAVRRAMAVTSPKLRIPLFAVILMAIGSIMDRFVETTWNSNINQESNDLPSKAFTGTFPGAIADSDTSSPNIEIPEIFRWSESSPYTDQYFHDTYTSELEEEIEAIRIRWRHLDDASIDSILITLFIENYSDDLSLDLVGQMVMVEVKKVLYRIDSLYLLPRFEQRAQKITEEILERSESPKDE